LPQQRYLAEEDGVTRWELCRSPYFVVERVEVPAGSVWAGTCAGETLQIWGTISGQARVSGGGETVALPAVTFTLLPAQLGPYTIAPEEDTVLLRAYLPAVEQQASQS
jgi:mannose-6-phosphate isomerase class I